MSEERNTAASWYEATRVKAPVRAGLNFALSVDVCVIGGGLAGLSVAREVARRGWSVVLLEARRLAWAASGRNTGFVLPGFQEDVDNMIERIGLDHTKRLWALSEQGLAHVRRTIEETGMAGVDPVAGWLHVSKTDDDGKIARARVERLRGLGAEVEVWPTEQVRDVLPNPHYFSAVHYPTAFHIHPLNYALGLADAAEAAGAYIFEQTPVLSIDTTGVRKRIVTPHARLRAHHVVLACNVHLGTLMPQLAATLVPLTTFVIVSEPLGSRLSQIIRYRGAVSDGEGTDNHYRIVGGPDPAQQRLQWSGRLRMWEANPRFIARGLLRDIKRNFPELGTVEIAYLWNGTLGRTLHRMPQIGEIDRGFWLASGFAGHGLNTTAMAGELIARGIVEGDDTWRLFAPYELVWAGGVAGRLVKQGMYWGSRLVYSAAQKLARLREDYQARRRWKAARQRLAEARWGDEAKSGGQGSAT